MTSKNLARRAIKPRRRVTCAGPTRTHGSSTPTAAARKHLRQMATRPANRGCVWQKGARGFHGVQGTWKGPARGTSCLCSRPPRRTGPSLLSERLCDWVRGGPLREDLRGMCPQELAPSGPLRPPGGGRGGRQGHPEGRTNRGPGTF